MIKNANLVVLNEEQEDKINHKVSTIRVIILKYPF